MRLVIYLVSDNQEKGPQIERDFEQDISDEQFELPPSDFAKRWLEPLATNLVVAARSLQSR